MSEMPKFKQNFIERTLNILDEYSDNTQYDVTLLLNCLLSLVVFPIEETKDEISLKSEIFKDKCVNKLEELKNKKAYINKDSENFFRNIRNSIAHLNIKTNSKNEIIEDITLWDKPNFRINISVDNLRKFARFVAEQYLQTFF